MNDLITINSLKVGDTVLMNGRYFLRNIKLTVVKVTRFRIFTQTTDGLWDVWDKEGNIAKLHVAPLAAHIRPHKVDVSVCC